MATVVLRFFSVGLCLIFTCSSQGELLVFPEGEVRSILCTAQDEDHFGINWRTADGGEFGNEGTFTVGDEEPATNGTKGRRVIFTASPEVNGITMTCVVVNFRQPSDSPEPLDFTIIIQGNLSAPNVDYHVREGSILFSWSPPFSHNITDVEPDISHYLVYVYGNGLPEYTVKTIKTRYILHNGNCGIDKYQVAIAAVNVVGVGEKYASPYFSMEVLRSVSNFKTDLSGDFPVLKLQLHSNCLDDVIYHVELVPTYSSGPSLNLSNTMQFGQTLLTLSSEEVTFNEYYKATSVTIKIQWLCAHHVSLFSGLKPQRVTSTAPDVHTIVRDGSILFSWSPPFSHNITDVEPDISHYLVTIINMEDHHSVLTVNTTDTEYLLQSQDCQLSDYQVEIAAVNVVGVGDKYTSPPLTLDVFYTVVTVSNTATVTFGGKSPEITFQLQFRRNCNKETSFDLYLMPTFTQQQLISISLTSQQQPTLTLQSGDIQLNELYDVTLTVDGTSTFELSLSTFDVQNVEVRLTNTEYEITCYFASGSEARGCRIVLINDEGEGREECNAQRLEGVGEAVIKATLPAGEYSLLVYDDDDDSMGQENPAYHTLVSSTSSDFHNMGCFPKASDLESSAGPAGNSENGFKELTVVLSVVFPMVFIITFLGIVGVVAVLVTRNRRVSKRHRHPECGKSAANEYVERKSFLGKHSTTESSGSSGSDDTTQQLTEGSSLSDTRESSESQGSMESNTTIEAELPPPSPAPSNNTHSSPNATNNTHSLPNATTEPPNTTTRTHNFPNLSEATTDVQQTPNTAETETNNLNRLSGPDSRDSGVNQESSPHSTAPVVSRQRNYIQVEPEAGWNIQRPPDIREDTVLYATILPHTSPPPTNP
ncbi:hypothetical protein GBAR_LOCUS6564 [Geodia barretti]|nr:hypothetical protein GBAR_LOCUS6564 [Geodia barretti]